MSALFLFKLIAAPLLIAAATLAGRRWGAAVGGWIAGLPLTSGPVSVFFALEQGPDFARRAAEATVLGVVAVVVFGVAYGRASSRFGPAISTLIALASYFAAAALISLLPNKLPLAFALVAIGIAIGLMLLGPSQADTQSSVTPAWDLPFRMIVAATMVILLTWLGARAGAQLAGLLSPIPVFAGTMAAFTHLVSGAPAAHRLVRGVLAGSLAFAAFFVVVALTVTRLPLVSSYGAAVVVALALTALVRLAARRVTLLP